MHQIHIPDAALTAPAVQEAFRAAVRNLVEINTIPRKSSGGGYLIRAGGGYDSPWTRDSAINTWAAGRLIVPEAARNTLLAVCVPDENGDLVIQPDDQQWDCIIWAVGAWQAYLATGDREFLALARGVTARTLERLHRERYCPETGLYRGGSFFNDGISGYPGDLYEPGVDHSFMGMHPKLRDIQCLSTNCIYCEAWRILGRMNALLGIPGPEPEARRRALKEAILRVFWDSETKQCAYLRYPDGRMDRSRELSGVTFGVLFGILPQEALSGLHREPRGIPSIWPPFPGLFSRERPGRHNNLIWPFLNGFFIQAAARAGLADSVGQELADLARMFRDSGGIYEIYDARDGSVNGGWQIGADGMRGHLWESCHDQTWSATGFLGAVIHGVFGVQIGEDAVSFAPCVPEFLKNSRIGNLVIRGKRFSVAVSGHGSRVTAVTVNGRPLDRAVIPFAEAAESNEIVLTLK